MKNGEDKEIIDKVFEIVSNDEVNKKFLDYNNNKEYFSIIRRYIFKRAFRRNKTRF